MASRKPVEPVLRLTRDAISRAHVEGVARIGSSSAERLAMDDHDTASLVLPVSGSPLHLTYRLSLLCGDITRRMPEFAHIDMRRVLISFVRCRNQRLWGLQAKLVPLSFRGGRRTANRRGHRYRIQQLYVGETRLRYVMSFYVPRFLNQSFDEKMITIFHELYHIGPDFSGDVRRFGAHGSVHAGSKRDYDRQMASFARRYLARKPPPLLHDFLNLSFSSLQDRYREIVGVQIPAPKLIPDRVAEQAARRRDDQSS